jgi:hypothetical protein
MLPLAQGGPSCAQLAGRRPTAQALVEAGVVPNLRISRLALRQAGAENPSVAGTGFWNSQLLRLLRLFGHECSDLARNGAE